MAIAVAAWGGYANAQSQPQVVYELKHDVSPPLGEMIPAAPIEPSAESPALGPRLHPRPEQPRSESLAPEDRGLQTFTRNRKNTRHSKFPGVGANGYAPPDTNGAAGTTQYVQWVNVKYAIYDKKGNLISGPFPGNHLWSGFGGPCETSNDGDPIAQFDKVANRWVMAQPVYSSPYTYCVAVSTSSDATGSYNRYAFSIPNNYFPDYPKLAVWPDAYYVSFNTFGSSGNVFTGALACALDRNAMLAGGAAKEVCFQLSPSVDSLLPSDLDGSTPPPAGSPNYFLGLNSNSTGLNLYKFHVDFNNSNNSTFIGPITIAVNPFSEACGGGTCIPQAGTSQRLDSLGDRLMYRLAYRNFGDHESLVVNHSVTAGSSVGVRWYELQQVSGGAFSVYQQGTFAPDSNYRWMGSIAMDKVGDIALGYSKSGSSMNPSIAYTVRLSTDPLNTMEAETTIINGTGSQTSGLSRWGDYSSMSIDPVDDCTFWYTNEYLQSNGSFNWSTYIASFALPNCTRGSTPDFGLSASPGSQTVIQGSSTTYTVNVNALNGFNGSVSLSASGPSGVSFDFSPSSVTGSGSSTMTVNVGSNTTPGAYTLTITGTDATGNLTHVTTVTLVVNSSTPPDFSISATPASRTVTRGSSTTYAVTVTPLNGFTGTVGFSISGLPSRSSASFSPTSVTGSGSSTLTVKTGGKTPRGTYNTLSIKGTSGSLVHSTKVTLTVQ